MSAGLRSKVRQATSARHASKPAPANRLQPRLLLAWLGAVLLAVAATGCGAGNAKLVNDLKQVGLAYHWFHDQHKRGPADWDEFAQFVADDAMAAESLNRVRAAGYDVKWNVNFNEVSQGLSNTVLASRPAGPPTLMMDGSVRE
jgi:hypothetical protein